ncbi:ATP-binding cassette domain-containing protein, partial [Myxococcota bacterium]|nr:ATP-binding cassette domain-containing protein [Myxococcota bacterium]
MTEVVRLQGVHKGFGGRPILAGVDLTLRAGQVCVVVGPSGGGKSVLLELIAGFMAPDAGEIEAPPRVGMVFQDGALFDDLSVRDNIGFPLRHEAAVARAAAVEAAAAAVDLSMGHLAARPAQLSGGLRKR